MKQGNPKKRVLMALSGGIDSAVSAWKLLQDGYEVEAAFMKNWSSTKGLKYDECPWLVDRQDALRVAAFLGIPLHTLDFEKDYEKNVLNYFFQEYKAGRTPNPDVMCNKEIKFKLLYNWAMQNGFDYIATGHYAQVKAGNKVVDNSKGQKTTGKSKVSQNAKLTKADYQDKLHGTFTLQRSADAFKDQTYFIYNISQSQLPHLLFPIGGLKKDRVKQMARKIGLPNADKKESMGLCFVGKIRLKEFLDQKIKPQPGDIVSLAGKKIGRHEGLAYYTIGQRQGVKIGADGPWYVVKKDLKSNQLVVTNNPNDSALLVKETLIHSVNWINGESVKFPSILKVRFRHQGELEPARIEPQDRGFYKVVFKRPQKALASGQSVVFYEGITCLGGGVIV